PELGRLTVPKDVPAGTEVRVDFHYGFGGELGGGEYERQLSDPDRPFRLIAVPSVEAPTIAAALTALAAPSPGGGSAADGYGVVEIQDSGRYEETLAIDAPKNGHREIRAASGCRPTLVLGGELV